MSLIYALRPTTTLGDAVRRRLTHARELSAEIRLPAEHDEAVRLFRNLAYPNLYLFAATNEPSQLHHWTTTVVIQGDKSMRNEAMLQCADRVL